MLSATLFTVLSVFFAKMACGQYFETQTHRCFNPNQRPGTCVSIYDCQTLVSVLQRGSIQPIDTEFLRASECRGGYGSGPYVCCTGDTGFTRNTYDDYSRQPSTVLFPAGSPEARQPQRHRQRVSDSNGGGRAFNSIGGDAGGGSGKQPRDVPAGGQLSESAATLPRLPTCGGVTISNKIYSGTDTDLYEFPWMVLLEYNRRSGGLSTNCAGSLINNRYVLTAAHCVKGAIEKQIGTLNAVRLGEYDTTRQVDCNQYSCAPSALRVGIEETIPHEQYRDNSANKENDIALIRLDQEIRFSDSIRPICLPSAVKRERSAPISGTLYTVAGWGRTLRSPKSATKQKLQIPLVDLEQCQRKYWERKVNVVKSHICAGGVYAEDSCEGDSGGPLMRFRNDAWVLEGIVSFGYKCGLSGWPAVHTRVAQFDDWIRRNIRN
ncbi:serine protease 7-like [Rhagoletis pomonella]|uniref:serine protease 7-like n=1 Tax=Rhagoletis pomonella TaxID=28610 RepID=UPI0017854AD0|nr:serine protease 7-like [Rhagoletis pomonella]